MELYIPVRRHLGNFDDFFKNRWLELKHSALNDEFDQWLEDWDMRMDNMRRDFFPFSSDVDTFPMIDSASTIKQGPTGNPEFAVRLDAKDFKPEEINVSTKGGKLTISGTHEEKSDTTVSRKEFKRVANIPENVQIDLMTSTLSKDGILSITAPVKPSGELAEATPPSAIESSPQTTQKDSPATAVATTQSDSQEEFNYSLSIAGFKPEEVTVMVKGRNVIIEAKHEESSGEHKVRNELTRSFELPSSVDPRLVRSYIKDGDTLNIVACFKDDLAGEIYLVPVTHKYLKL